MHVPVRRTAGRHAEPRPLSVDSSRVRSSNTLPKGSVLDSHILHADKIGNTGQVVGFDGTYTFAEPVVGLIWNGTKLNNTDSLLGVPGNGTTAGIDYEASAVNRQFEITGAGGGGDTATVSADGLTVTFHTSQSTGADEVRILTGLSPRRRRSAGPSSTTRTEMAPVTRGSRGCPAGRSAPMKTQTRTGRQTPARPRSPTTPPTQTATSS